jgi:hypothetical protein
MARTERQIFVLDVANEPAFAFEADNTRAAEALVLAPWFLRALEDFCAKRRKARSANAGMSTRAATEAEATLYRERAAEFAEAADHVLVAHLTGA